MRDYLFIVGLADPREPIDDQVNDLIETHFAARPLTDDGPTRWRGERREESEQDVRRVLKRQIAERPAAVPKLVIEAVRA
jgi:hypothetical protein